MSITIEADKAFFWSDLHLFHKAAQRARGYDNLSHMNEKIIHEAALLKKTDTLVLIGDVSFGKFEETRDILGRIAARKVLVMGNHDSGLAQHLDILFDEVHHLLRVKVVQYAQFTGRKEKLAEIVCCHYPLLAWDKMHHGSWHLHGHCHGSLRHPGRVGKMVDVGYDVHSKPQSYHDIKSIMDLRQIVPYDHHKPDMEDKGGWTL